MITANYAQPDNIILSIENTDYLLERKIGYNGTWEPWNGSSWGGVPVYLTSNRFTDYQLSEGIYQYRYQPNGETEYVTSNCVVIGQDPVGWSFYNYEVPEGQFGEVLTPDDIRYSFLWGVSFTATDGQQWTDNQTRKAVEWATEQIGRKLNIQIYHLDVVCDDSEASNIEETKTLKKLFPFSAKKKRQFLIRLRHRPIREVSRLDWFSTVDSKIANLLPWMRLDRQKGFLWFHPKYGALQTYAGYSWPWNALLREYNYPDAFHVNYKAGYANAEMVPEDLREIIGKVAALKLLNVIGDGLIAGFSSSSLSLDGMSESFSSTQSATSAFFGARILQYEKSVSEYLKENKWKYSNVPIGSI